VDRSVLLKPSLRAALEGPRARLRVGLATDHRWPWLSRAVIPGTGHRQLDLDRVARAAGALPEGRPALAPSWQKPSTALPQDAVLVLPLSASGKTVDWPGARALADLLAARGLWAVFAAGPGQDAALARLCGPHRRLPALPLPELAAAAVQARAVVGNDSGLTHLAAAARRGAGRSPEAVVAVHGSTDPARTGALGATLLGGPRPPCWPCYRKRCPHGLPGLQLAPESVVKRVIEQLEPPAGRAA
jgi:ADP-heptose:LPS heptosyltransferase